MSDISNAIMDAAERRIRKGGFNGFSFREIAADVGVKSSSVHYHFPTKEKLAEAVIRRYTDDVSDHIDEMFLANNDPVQVWTTALRGTVVSDERMCPCTVMGATALDLPAEVVEAIKDFFKMCHQKMIEQGLDSGSADLLLATLIGAQVISNTMGNVDTFDRVVAEQMRIRHITAPKPVAA
jgi:TetR/AcrR family transcriptional repressor of nem operon